MGAEHVKPGAGLTACRSGPEVGSQNCASRRRRRYRGASPTTAALRSLITTFTRAPGEEPIPLAFGKPIKDRKTAEVSHHVWWCAFDKSTAGPGRLVFEGAPTIQGDGLTIALPRVDVCDGERLDLSLVKDLNQGVDRGQRRHRAYPRQAHHLRDQAREGRPRRQAPGVRDHRDHRGSHARPRGRDAARRDDDRRVDNSGVEHMRLQSPFRKSSSWAAFYSTLGGSPFLFDMGDRTKHVLDADRLRPARDIMLEWARAYYRP